MSRVYRSSLPRKTKPLCPWSDVESFMEEVVCEFVTEPHAELFQSKHTNPVAF